MRQIEADELRHVIRFELGRLGKMTLRDMGSTHGNTRKRGLDIAVASILDRMEKWEIIVPEAAGNIFEVVGNRSGAGQQKGPT